MFFSTVTRSAQKLPVSGTAAAAAPGAARVAGDVLATADRPGLAAPLAAGPAPHAVSPRQTVAAKASSTVPGIRRGTAAVRGFLTGYSDPPGHR
jgi:hypothetical protein